MWVPYHRCPSIYSTRKPKFENDLPSFLLSKPKTKKLDGENIITSSGIEIGHSSMQGYRKNMEDHHIIQDFNGKCVDHTLVAVMDGHAGDGSALYTSLRLLEVIEETVSWKEYLRIEDKGKEESINIIRLALAQAFVDIDDEIRTADYMDMSGCTCVCAIITPTHVVCANVGDSRCVLGLKPTVVNNTIALSDDHKPSNEEEKLRIENGGGFVLDDRVNGELAMSRALGDFRYKSNKDADIALQLVLPIPDIAVHKRSPSDEVLILACDGVWDVMSNNEAVDFVTKIVPLDFGVKDLPLDHTTTTVSAEKMAEALIDLALSCGSTDNITALIAKFNK